MLFLLGLFLGCVFGIIAVHNNPAISPNSHASLIISNSVTSIGFARRLPALCLYAFRSGFSRYFSRSPMLLQYIGGLIGFIGLATMLLTGTPALALHGNFSSGAHPVCDPSILDSSPCTIHRFILMPIKGKTLILALVTRASIEQKNYQRREWWSALKLLKPVPLPYLLCV